MAKIENEKAYYLANKKFLNENTVKRHRKNKAISMGIDVSGLSDEEIKYELLLFKAKKFKETFTQK